MARKRKRGTSDILVSHDFRAHKHARIEHASLPTQGSVHPTLSLYYNKIWSLRDFLLRSIPGCSKTRRRSIAKAGLLSSAKLGKKTGDDEGDHDCQEVASHPDPSLSRDGRLAAILDGTLICSIDLKATIPLHDRVKELETFSQQVSLTSGSDMTSPSLSQRDIVDFAVWLLFNRVHRHVHRPPHLLCHGFQRAQAPRSSGEDHCALAGIPGLVAHYPNNSVNLLKGLDWARILAIIGKDGEKVMLDLLLDHDVFSACATADGNLSQLSGTPLHDRQPTRMQSLDATLIPRTLATTTGAQAPILRSPGAITFVRSRIFYARPALNAKGDVTVGLRHIHALNRYADPANLHHTVQLMKYMFPRQFDLHNVFTSRVDARETVQPFKDYTLREQEILQQDDRMRRKKPDARDVGHRIPKRLRGEPVKLVQTLQKSHARCSYSSLLEHYCPADLRDHTTSQRSKPNGKTKARRSRSGRTFATQADRILGTRPQAQTSAAADDSPVKLATSHAQVSAFCKACMSRLIPAGFWGQGQGGQHHKELFMKNVDTFIRLRRFENMSLHTCYQRFKLHCVGWLSSSRNGSTKASLSDTEKRKEIFLEFLYYCFDSVLVPLIRSNFHVTESNAHRNRIFYFRHDVWRALTEPAMTRLKMTMYDEVPISNVGRLLDSRALGFSQLRLLPKTNGFRPITNLRRRASKLQNGRVTLARSINSVMSPVFNMLDLERKTRPSLAGSSLFSVGDIYPKLLSFRNMLLGRGKRSRQLFFAKVDVRSCFDTIPQQAVVSLMARLASEEEYRIARHAEIECARIHDFRRPSDRSHAKPARKFLSTARRPTDHADFDRWVEKAGKKNTVFVDSVVLQHQQTRKLIDLLEQHVQGNVVKIGKRFFRQKSGIPQGSILSSLLCNLFYAQFENEHLSFLDRDQGLLVRLIDDFLLITTSKGDATRFLQTMHKGVAAYGIEVNPSKTLVNFDLKIDECNVPKWSTSKTFPYCGNMIDMTTLEVTKDRQRRKATMLEDSLTVETSKTPGKTFYRKALNAFKIQTHRMLLDTRFNSIGTVLSTIYENFIETAMKYSRYWKSMAPGARPHHELLIGTIRNLIDLAFVLVKAKHKGHTMYQCAVSKRQVAWLATNAFRHVLARKQSQFWKVLEWVDQIMMEVKPTGGREPLRLARIVKQGQATFGGYKY